MAWLAALAKKWVVGDKKGVLRVLAVAASLSMTACIFYQPIVADEDEGADEAETEESGDDTTGYHPCGPTQGVVDFVIDGDTVQLTTGERVRYILVDTPETSPDNNECWGEQATTFNWEMVAKQTVTLEYDAECKDIYGRLLAYVSVDGVEVNRALLENGHACVLHIPPNGSARLSEYLGLEAQAQEAGAGLWSGCGSAPC